MREHIQTWIFHSLLSSSQQQGIWFGNWHKLFEGCCADVCWRCICNTVGLGCDLVWTHTSDIYCILSTYWLVKWLRGQRLTCGRFQYSRWAKSSCYVLWPFWINKILLLGSKIVVRWYTVVLRLYFSNYSSFCTKHKRMTGQQKSVCKQTETRKLVSFLCFLLQISPYTDYFESNRGSIVFHAQNKNNFSLKHEWGGPRRNLLPTLAWTMLVIMLH